MRWVYTSEAKGFASQHSNCDCSVVPSWDAENAHIDGYDPEVDHRRYKRARASVPAQGVGETSDEFTARVLRQAREMFPDDYTDGVTVDKRLRYGDGTITASKWRRERADIAKQAKKGVFGHEAFARRIPPAKPDKRPADWPKDFPIFNDKAWNHILYGYDGGSGHLPGYEWKKRGTTFPVNWTKNDVFSAVKETIKSGADVEWRDDRFGSIVFRYKERNVRVAVEGSRTHGSVKRIVTAYLDSR